MTEQKTIVCLAILAFLHVLVFSALFPFYQITDEQCHLDLAVHYANHGWPKQYVHFDREASYYCAMYNALDLVSSRNVDEMVTSNSRKYAIQDARLWMQWTNHESAQPPLYYFYTGSVWRISKAAGLKDAMLPYVMRCSNGLLLGLTVIISWLIAALVFPGQPFIRIGAPGLVACMPQSIFYCVSNDNLVAPTCGLAAYLMLRIWQSPTVSAGMAGMFGLSLSAALLAKVSSLPLVGVLILFFGFKVFALGNQRELKSALAASGICGVFFLAPVVVWMIWCKLHFHDWTGSATKLELLGWRLNPCTDWLSHPIFTPRGFWFFVSHNITTFWQGEARWHLALLRNPILDCFYLVFTIAVLITVCKRLLCLDERLSSIQRVHFKFVLMAGLFAYLFSGLLSIMFDFGDCWYPSKYQPYFTSGRLALGILAPLATLAAFAIDTWLGDMRHGSKIGFLGLFMLFMIGAEVAVDSPVYSSWYNMIHLPDGLGLGQSWVQKPG